MAATPSLTAPQRLDAPRFVIGDSRLLARLKTPPLGMFFVNVDSGRLLRWDGERWEVTGQAAGGLSFAQLLSPQAQADPFNNSLAAAARAALAVGGAGPGLGGGGSSVSVAPLQQPSSKAAPPPPLLKPLPPIIVPHTLGTASTVEQNGTGFVGVLRIVGGHYGEVNAFAVPTLPANYSAWLVDGTAMIPAGALGRVTYQVYVNHVLVYQYTTAPGVAVFGCFLPWNPLWGGSGALIDIYSNPLVTNCHVYDSTTAFIAAAVV